MTVATGQSYPGASLQGPTEPWVTGITSCADTSGVVRVYRVWSDGLTEATVKINGSENYQGWNVMAE